MLKAQGVSAWGDTQRSDRRWRVDGLLIQSQKLHGGRKG
jgi:hypothetical protein